MSKTKLALDVVNDLRSLADSIEVLVGVIDVNQTEASEVDSKEVKKPSDSRKEAAPEPKQPTLEEVRAAMAEKNRESHREAVKAILHKYGANKLTTLDPAHFAQVLKEVGEIK